MLNLNATTLSLLLLACLLSSQALAHSIKGHSRPSDESRSLKTPVQAAETKAALKAPVAIGAAAAAAAPASPVHSESPKKIFNEEQPIKQQSPPEIVAPVAAPVAPIAAPVVPVAPIAPVVAQPAPVEASPAVVAPVAAPVAPVAAPAPVIVVQDAPVVSKLEHVQPEPVKPVSEPLMSERSAVPVVVVEQPAPVVAPAAPQESVPVVAEKQQPLVQPAPLVPVVVVAAAAPAEVVPEKKQIVAESPLEAKKDDHVAVQHQPAHAPHSHVEPLPEVPAPDPQLVLSEPIDSTTKLLIDLDEHVQKFLPQEDKEHAAKPVHDPSLIAGIDFSPADPKGKSAPLQPYSGIVSDDSIVPPLPVLESVEKSTGAASGAVAGQASPSSPLSPASPASPASSSSQPEVSASRQGNNNHNHNHNNQNQQQVITQLMDQLDSLQNRIQDTINQLVARRRYVMSALLRPMGTYVRRVRTNLERLQNRVNQLQAAASSVGSGNNRPGGFVDAAAIETIRRRIDDISKRISDIVNRIRFSLTPTSAPLSSSNGK